MKQKTITALMLAVLLLAAVVPVQAQESDISGADIIQFGNYNCYFTAMKYISANQTLYFVAKQDSNVNESIGLGLLIIKFHLTKELIFKDVTATVNGQPAKDMLKNYTYQDGEFLRCEYLLNGSYIEEIVPCKYLKVYFYLYEDHHIINEKPIPYNLKPEADNSTSSSLSVSEPREVNARSSESVRIQMGNFDSITSDGDVMPIVVGIGIVLVVLVLLGRKFLQRH